MAEVFLREYYPESPAEQTETHRSPPERVRPGPGRIRGRFAVWPPFCSVAEGTAQWAQLAHRGMPVCRHDVMRAGSASRLTLNVRVRNNRIKEHRKEFLQSCWAKRRPAQAIPAVEPGGTGFAEVRNACFGDVDCRTWPERSAADALRNAWLPGKRFRVCEAWQTQIGPFPLKMPGDRRTCPGWRCRDGNSRKRRETGRPGLTVPFQAEAGPGNKRYALSSRCPGDRCTTILARQLRNCWPLRPDFRQARACWRISARKPVFNAGRMETGGAVPPRPMEVDLRPLHSLHPFPE